MGLKREHEEDEAGPKKKAKPARKAASLVEMSTNDLKEAIDAGTLNKSTVAELKDWLQSKGLNSSGKKVDLVDRIEQWIENA